MMTIELPRENFYDLLSNRDDEIKIVGKVTANDMDHLLFHNLKILDLTEAVFGNDTVQWSQFRGHGHSGPVYGNSGTKEIDVLKEYLRKISTLNLFLPDDVARRHITAIQRNSYIFHVEVRETCKLFSMKDGDIYNKKGTTLVYKQRTPIYESCAVCGETHFKQHLIDTGYGTRICFGCKLDKYFECSNCGKLYRANDLYTPKYSIRSFCPNCRKDKD